jgi:hypothetical protein
VRHPRAQGIHRAFEPIGNLKTVTVPTVARKALKRSKTSYPYAIHTNRRSDVVADLVVVGLGLLGFAADGIS